MNTIDNQISAFNKYLLSEAPKQGKSLGLFDGKTGWAIYLYEMSQLEANNKLENVAAILINEVCTQSQFVNSMDLNNGVSGIGLGISYLIRNKFITGDINKILSDIDDKVFKELSDPTLFEKTDILGVIQMTYYIIDRLESLKKNSENEYLFKELLIHLSNKLYQNISIQHFEEPLFYTAEYLLPQFLRLFSKIFKLNFYNDRLLKIIHELSFYILSTFPRLHTNRLFLLWAIDALNKQMHDKELERYISFLYNHFDIDEVFNRELPSYNIFINDGYSGIYLLLIHLNQYFAKEKIAQCKRIIVDKVLFSQSRIDPSSNTGLYNGYCGTYLALSKF